LMIHRSLAETRSLRACESKPFSMSFRIEALTYVWSRAFSE
jgi:hypothetical protein